jgi:sugar/nucleoside kinase (ribokinase family)
MTAFAVDLAALRCSSGIASRPLIVWEPAPASCVSANADAHLEAARFVDVYSPNHIEFLATFHDGGSRAGFDRDAIAEHALQLLKSGVGEDGQGAVVVRCGEHGCLVASNSYPARWFPAFYRAGSSRVVDATGAGNAFLGAFAVIFGISSNLDEAAIAGSVAASFLVEQVGLPDRTSKDGKEVWNGEAFLDRVERYGAMLNARRGV